MKFLRSVKGCLRQDRKPSQTIRRQLKVNSIHEKQNTWKHNWIQHLHRIMQPERLPKQMWNYRPRGRRDIATPGMRWSWSSEQVEGPNPWTQTVIMMITLP